MRDAGVTVVTVAVFAWARLQPAPGVWDDDWLRRILDLLHRNGIAVDLATATASPPPWLVRAHPEIRPVDARGTRLEIGSRQTWCPSSPVFREHSLTLVRQLAERFGDHPAVVMWHVSNELGNHNGSCYCDVSGHDLVSQTAVDGELRLAAGGYAVVVAGGADYRRSAGVVLGGHGSESCASCDEARSTSAVSSPSSWRPS